MRAVIAILYHTLCYFIYGLMDNSCTAIIGIHYTIVIKEEMLSVYKY